MSEEPYTDAEEKLAESLVDEAMEKYAKFFTPEQHDEVREYMVDMLLATKEGRRKLALVKPYGITRSDEVDRFGNPLVPIKSQEGEK